MVGGIFMSIFKKERIKNEKNNAESANGWKD
jgi:hypothetical protein